MIRGVIFYIVASIISVNFASSFLNIPFERSFLKIFSSSILKTTLAPNAKCPTSDPCLNTLNGQIVGSLSEDKKTEIYSGIPYAEAPTGNLRWTYPRPKTSWSKPMIAQSFGPVCIQGTKSLFNLIPGFNAAGPQSEDCLTLNILKPKGATNLPILFWIHGGGYSNGAGSLPLYTDNPDFAKNALLITINYRLGPLGFLAHSQLSAENPDKISGNYGLYDILTALKWVNTNAKELGGDPKKLMIFGESAGGNAVITLIQSPLAKNLFSSAVIQSPIALKPSIQKNMLRDSDPNKLSGEELGIAVAQRVGCDPVPLGRTITDCLRAKKPKDIEKAFNEATDGADPFPFMPYIDGKLVTDSPWNQFKNGDFNKVPIVIGVTKDELLLSTKDELLITNKVPLTWSEVGEVIRKDGVAMGIKDLDNLVALYSLPNYNSPFKAINYYTYDSMFFCPVRNFLQTLSKKGDVPVRGYYYTHKTSFFPVGSAHGTELFYLFGPDQFKKLFKPEELTFSEVLQKAWISVAKNYPYLNNFGKWPIFKGDEENWVQLDLETKIVSGMRKKECDFFDRQNIY